MAENDQEQPQPGLAALAVPPTPTPNLGNLLAAFGNMELTGAPAPQAPQWAPQPYDPAAVLAEMPDIEDGRGPPPPQGPQFTPQPQQQHVAQAESRGRRGRGRPESVAAPEPEPEPEALEAQQASSGGPPAKVVAEVIGELDDIAEDVEEDDPSGDVAAAASDGFKAIWQVVEGMQQNIIALARAMDAGAGDGSAVSSALVTPPPGTSGAMSREEAIAVMQGLLVCISFFEMTTGDPKLWQGFMQSLPVQTRAMLLQTMEQLPALVQQALGVMQERTGVSLRDIMQQVDPEALAAEAKKHGITLPPEVLRR